MRNKISFHEILTNYQKKNSNFIVEKSGQYHVDQVIKVDITIKTYQYYEPPNMIH